MFVFVSYKKDEKYFITTMTLVRQRSKFRFYEKKNNGTQICYD